MRLPDAGRLLRSNLPHAVSGQVPIADHTYLEGSLVVVVEQTDLCPLVKRRWIGIGSYCK